MMAFGWLEWRTRCACLNIARSTPAKTQKRERNLGSSPRCGEASGSRWNTFGLTFILGKFQVAKCKL